MLVRLLYASRAGEGKLCDVVQSVMQQSREHNPQHGITGILCHSDQVFMQVLEGGREAINTLFGHATPRILRIVIASSVDHQALQDAPELLFDFI